MSEMIEMIGKIIAEGIDDAESLCHNGYEGHKKAFDEITVAILKALREPTEEMIEAACNAVYLPRPLKTEEAQKIGWRAIIDSVLTHPTQDGDRE